MVNSVTPALYGQGFGATAPVPSVTLTQTKNGAGNPIPPIVVEGSLVLNTATNSITFVATDTASVSNNGTPILPDGTYTVDVPSHGATGFQALNPGGGFLDGLGTGTAGGGDYMATFTIGAAAAGDDVVWVPATADGPGQSLTAPGKNLVGGGYPVYLNDKSGKVTSVGVTFNYNPALLQVTGAISNSALPGSSFTLNSGLSTPGHAVLQYTGSGANSGNLVGGQVPLGFITAVVPSGTSANPTPYKAKDLLTLTGIAINGGAIPAVAGNALHLVAYVGDADGNGAYSSNDAVLITQAVIQANSGFAAYPLVDPVIVADTEGAGFIPADAALQANEAGVGFPTASLSNPPIPGGVVFQAIANNVDPMLSLQGSIQGSGVRGQGSVITVAVNIDDADPVGSTGLIEGHLALTYDPSEFTVSASDIHLGSVLAGGSGWILTPTIDQATGQIAIALSSTTPITSTAGGSLMTIDLHEVEGVRGQGSGVREELSALAPDPWFLTPDPWPLTPVQLVAAFNVDGNYVATELEDAQGTFTLTPAPPRSR